MCRVAVASARIPTMPTISDDEAAFVVRALEHYHAYLVAATDA